MIRPTVKVFVDGAAWFLTERGWVSGKCLTGWIQELSDAGQRWWYVDKNYKCLAGVVMEIDGKVYAFDLAGWMITSDRIVERGEII